MAVKLTLVPGTYYAGMTLPWYASHGLVEDALKKAGFTAIVWHKKAEAPPIDPTRDPAYSKDWEEWLSASVATGKDVSLPARPAWIVGVPAPGAVAPAPIPAPAGTVPSASATPAAPENSNAAPPNVILLPTTVITGRTPADDTGAGILVAAAAVGLFVWWRRR